MFQLDESAQPRAPPERKACVVCLEQEQIEHRFERMGKTKRRFWFECEEAGRRMREMVPFLRARTRAQANREVHSHSAAAKGGAEMEEGRAKQGVQGEHVMCGKEASCASVCTHASNGRAVRGTALAGRGILARGGANRGQGGWLWRRGGRRRRGGCCCCCCTGLRARKGEAAACGSSFGGAVRAVGVEGWCCGRPPFTGCP